MTYSEAECVFCSIVRGAVESWRLHETSSALAFLAVPGFTDYHAIVVPKAHYADIFEVPREVLLHVTSAVKDLVALYRERLNISNLQIINSSGHEAQQTAFHLHFHVVPRRLGDGLDIDWTPRPSTPQYRNNLISRLR